jgi:hypothetical protein
VADHVDTLDDGRAVLRVEQITESSFAAEMRGQASRVSARGDDFDVVVRSKR